MPFKLSSTPQRGSLTIAEDIMLLKRDFELPAEVEPFLNLLAAIAEAVEQRQDIWVRIGSDKAGGAVLISINQSKANMGYAGGASLSELANELSKLV